MRYCLYPGCNNIVQSGYCDEHKKYNHPDDRPSSHKRGYTTKWEKVRAVKIKQNPLCEMCEKKGIITPSDIVHHIVPISQGGAVLDYDNLMSLCNKCHAEVHHG